MDTAPFAAWADRWAASIPLAANAREMIIAVAEITARCLRRIGNSFPLGNAQPGRFVLRTRQKRPGNAQGSLWPKSARFTGLGAPSADCGLARPLRATRGGRSESSPLQADQW